MIKEILLVILIPVAIPKANAQTITGKWYGIEKDRVVELRIDDDSISMQALDLNFESKGYTTLNNAHKGIYALKNRTLIVTYNNSDLKYSAIVFFNVKEKALLEIAANDTSKRADTKEELLALSKQDTTKLKAEIMFFNEHYVPILKNMKPVDQMVIQEFKAFLKTFISRRSQYENDQGFVNSVMMFRGTVRIFVELGYNPFIDMDKLNMLFKKFSYDDEVKVLVKQL